MVGKPREKVEAVDRMREEEYGRERLKAEHLRELSGFLERYRINSGGFWTSRLEGWVAEERSWALPKRREEETVRFLINKFDTTTDIASTTEVNPLLSSRLICPNFFPKNTKPFDIMLDLFGYDQKQVKLASLCMILRYHAHSLSYQ